VLLGASQHPLRFVESSQSCELPARLPPCLVDPETGGSLEGTERLLVSTFLCEKKPQHEMAPRYSGVDDLLECRLGTVVIALTPQKGPIVEHRSAFTPCNRILIETAGVIGAVEIVRKQKS
jgi:hypothetical protein